MRRQFGIVLMVVCLLGGAVQAAVPMQLNYQGRVTGTSGAAVLDGTYPMVFSLYRQLSGGSPLWSESRSVGFTNGVYTVQLGAGVPLPATAFTDSGTAYLNIIFNGELMSPRQLLSSQGYAVNAAQAEALKSYSTDTISEKTSGAGVTVDGLLIKDGGLPAYPGVTMYRQAVINGNFDVWQRGTSFSNPNSTLTSHCADRWIYYRPGFSTGITVSRQAANLNGSVYAARVQRAQYDSSAGTLFFEQAFETIDAVKFRGQVVTVSFYARAGANFSAAGAVLYSNLATGTGTDQTVRDGYTGLAFAKSQSNTLTTSWQRYSMTLDAPLGSSVNEFTVRFQTDPTGTAGAQDYFELTQVELNTGTVALPFQPRSFEEELRSCMRYYEKSFGYDTTPGVNIVAGNVYFQAPAVTNGCPMGSVYFREPKRTSSPSVTLYNPFAANSYMRLACTSVDLAYSLDPHDWGFGILNQSGSSSAAGCYHLQFSVDAEM